MLGRMRRKSARRGFTLVEAIVIAIAAVMFAMILFTATNMVNMSLVYDSDRVALMHFIETGVTAEGTHGSITVTVHNHESGNEEQFVIDLNKGDLTVEGEYVEYVTEGAMSSSSRLRTRTRARAGEARDALAQVQTA